MKQDNLNLGNLFLGFIILGFGILTLAELFDFLGFNLVFNFSYFLPILFIWAGFSFLKPKQNFYFAGIVFVIIVTLLVFYSVFQFGFQNQETIKEKIEIENNQEIESAILNINIGAGELKLNGETSKLLKGTFTSDFAMLEKNISLEENIKNISLSTKEKEDVSLGQRKNILDLNINPDINSQIFINSGASNLDLNLKNLLVSYLKINSGASKIDIVLPKNLDGSKIEVEAGASSINILVPQNLGVKILVESGVLLKTIKDFEEINNSEYTSFNYNDSNEKIDIYLDLGISDFNIEYE